MAVKRLIYMAIVFASALVCGCENDVDMLTEQKNAIVKYLTSTRRMVAQEDVGSVIEENPAFYTAFGQSTYRHITNFYEEGRDEWNEVGATSSVTINFAAYTFGSSEPTINDLYWSNIPAIISEVEAKSGHNYSDLIWSDKPLVVQLGRGEIIEGLEAALIGCRDQDSVQIYMTSEAAYGKNIIGSVPKSTPVAWYIKILNVIK